MFVKPARAEWSTMHLIQLPGKACHPKEDPEVIMKWWDTVFLFIYIYTWRWLNIYECLFIACDGTILRFPMWFHPVRTCCYCSGCWVQILPTIWLWEWYLVLKCFEWFWYSLLLSTIVAIASWATGEWQGATSRSRPVQCYIPWIQYIYIFTYCWLHVTYNIFCSCFLNCFQEPRPA